MTERTIPSIHGVDHTRGGPDPIPPDGTAIYAIEVVENYDPVVVNDDQFNWMIPEDLDGAVLTKVEGYVNTTSSSGNVEVQITKVDDAGDESPMLTTKVVIAAGELNSFEPPGNVGEVDPGNEVVIWGDHLRVDVDASGDALGLGMILYFVPLETKAITLEGSQGPAGGVDDWTGEHSTVTNYVTNQSVSYGGSSYVAITNNVNVVPGVTPGWEASWQLLVEAHTTSAIQVVISGVNQSIDVGLKAYAEVPFDCTIDEAIVLADQATDCIVDIWKSDYGSFPPLVGDSITGAAPLTVTASNKTLDTSLAGWTTGLAAGDILAYNVDSNTNASKLTVSLKVLR